MTSRNQNKPPGNAPRSPSNTKDNFDEIPVDKRRKTGREAPGSLKMAGPTVRTRQAFSVVNAGQESLGNPNNGGLAANQALNNGNVDCGLIEFTKEDVEALLNEKMKGKNKFDYKGKSEQMQEYIKKLRLCIRWFQEQEEKYLLQQETLQKTLEAVESKHAEIEAQMKNKEEELNRTVAELRRDNASLQTKFSKEEADKLAAMKSYKQETDARAAVEKLRISLSEELEKAREEGLRASEQISLLQDTNKRLQEYNTSLQQYSSKLQNDNAIARESISRIETEKNAMKETLSSLRSHSDSLKEQLIASKASREDALKQKEQLMKEVGCLTAELQQVREDRDSHISQEQGLRDDIARYTEITGKSFLEIDHLTAKANSLEETCSYQKDQIRTLQQQLSAANEKLQMADSTSLERWSQCEEQKKVLQDLQNRLRDAENQIVEGELLRKKLHNTILELKGNIRVFCRVRPLLPDDDCRSPESVVVSYPSSTELLGRGIDLVQSPAQKHSFSFDKVFNHESSQEDVFVEISQLVQSALDGYKVCIFAYGQTGSGKTYTMMGRPEAPKQKGLIPRSLEQIFQTSQSLSSQGWRFKMQASMLEIYNETIRDLLPGNRLCSSDGSRMDNGVVGKQYAIKHENGNTHVSDLTIVDVSSFSEVSSLLHRAAQSRSVGKTQMNEQSSRSHFVFTLRIFGVNESIDQEVQGVLNLIDLAGSERLNKSGSTGERLKETQAINSSLKYLGDVILAIANKDPHVPFRNSKLTYLLQPCLGGDSKTLMFVNISPDPSSLNESLCSLRFAAKVNACEIGVPRRQTHSRNSDSRLSIS